MTAICHDCGVDTTPCTGKRGCRHKDRWEYYMVHNDLWHQAWGSNPAGDKPRGFLCVRCLERRLGGPLFPDDFPDFPVNWPSPWDTPYLRAAKGQDR